MQSTLLQVNKQKVRVRETHEKQTVKNEGKHTNIQAGKIKMKRKQHRTSTLSSGGDMFHRSSNQISELQNRETKTHNERRN